METEILTKERDAQREVFESRERFTKYQLVVGLSLVCFLHVLNDVVKEFLHLEAKIWWIF